MNRVIYRTIAETALRTVLSDLDARVPDAGPFPEHRWAVPFPPPYGPQLRLEIRVQPGRASFEGCVLTQFVGGTQQELASGSKAQVRKELESAETPARMVRFLDRALEDVIDLLEGMQSFDLPLVAIHRNGAPYAVLDHRDVGLERWSAGDLHCAWWRLLLRRDGAWRDAGVVHHHAEGARFYLHDRILKTLAVFDGLSAGELSFRLWKPSSDEAGEPIRHHARWRVWWGNPPEGEEEIDESEIDRSDPAVARLREICRGVIAGTPNQEQALLDVVRAESDSRRAGEGQGAV